MPYKTVLEDGVRSPKHKFHSGQVLYTKIRPYLAKVVIADRDGLCSADMYPIDTDLEARFLKWWMLSPSFTALAAGQQARTVLPKINVRSLNRLPVPVPPLEEQRRIVDTLETHLSHLDATARGIAGINRKATAFERSVLLHEVTGGPRRIGSFGSLEHSLPEGWRWARWADLGTSQNGRAFPSKDYSADGVRLIRPGNLSIDGTMSWTSKNTRWLPETYREAESAMLVGPGEIVMNLTAQSLKDDFLGRVCMTGSDDLALLNQRLARITPVQMHPRFAFHVFRSPLFRQFVASLNTGSLIQHMFTKQLAEFQLPVPPMPEQIQIAGRIDELIGDSRRLLASTDRADRKATGLRRTILEAAFGGGLSFTRRDLNSQELTGV